MNKKGTPTRVEGIVFSFSFPNSLSSPQLLVSSQPQRMCFCLQSYFPFPAPKKTNVQLTCVPLRA
jgi:hypothetical protein